MANPFINARPSILFVNTIDPITADGTDLTIENFVAAACLTNVSFDGTTSPISATSKCSDGQFAESVGGEQGWTFGADGLAVPKEVGDLRKNHNDMFKIWRSSAPYWWMIADKNATEDSVTIRYGVGRIDSDSDAFPDNEAQTFSISITGIGYIFDQDDLAPVTP